MHAFARYVRLIQRFWHWWITELWMMVPAPLRRLCGKRRCPYVVAFDGESAALMRDSAILSEIDFAAPPARLSDRLHKHVPAKRGRRRVTIRLPMHQALRTNLTLPLAAEENLHQVLGFELDRRTPFRVEDVHFAHCVTRRDRSTQSLEVALTVVPRKAIDKAIALVRGLGFEPEQIEVAQAQGHQAERLPLQDAPSGKARRLGTLVRVAIAGAFLASAVAAYASSQSGSDEREWLTRQVGEARGLAAKVSELQDKIAALESDRSLTALSAARLRGNAWLSELTRLLPDDTWLDRLSLSPKKVTMSGHSSSSSTVIRLLEESQLFDSPTFAAPVTQHAETGTDEFTISAGMKGAAR